jgi:uncharacterized protein
LDSTALFLVAGGLAGGFISGLSGFGAGLVALPILLIVLPPQIAALLAATCGMAGQIQTLPSLKYALRWQQVVPIALAGMAGVAAGIWWLPRLPVSLFKAGVGATLIVYSLFALVLPEGWRFRKRHPIGDFLVGIAGGLTGGIAGIPGPPIIMWAALQHWSADEKRSLIQTFNIATLSFLLVASAASGMLTEQYFWATILLLPSTIVGAIAGAATYRQLNDRRYQRLVILMLLLSGIGMVIAR